MKKIKRFEDLTFTDDFMFCKILQDKEICTELIERLLKIKVRDIKFHVSQYAIDHSPDSHGVRFDVYVQDSDRVFDIEMQTYNRKDIKKRSRYYQSAIDIDYLERGKSYIQLPESYVVFICTEDPLGLGLSSYTVHKKVEENGNSPYNDGTHLFLFNASAYESENDDDIREFLCYLVTKKPHSDFTEILHKRVSEYKNSDTARTEYMIKPIWIQDLEIEHEEALKESRELGIKEGIEQGLEQGLELGRAEGLEAGRAEQRRIYEDIIAELQNKIKKLENEQKNL